MELKELSQKWALLDTGKAGIQSIRLDSETFPDLFIGINKEGYRNLILKLPSGFVADFQSSTKQNLSLELYAETKWVVLSLLDDQYSDLFDDLIYSIYYKVREMESPKAYISEFLMTYYKWSEFFQDNRGDTLSNETIRGLLGELIYLHEQIKTCKSGELNDVLNTWKGPYDTGHDFIGEFKNTEVKTRTINSSGILISSEYQLESEPNKELDLLIVTIESDPEGITLKELVMMVRESIGLKLGDFGIIITALLQKGLTTLNLDVYDHLRYHLIEMSFYEVGGASFPKLIRSGLNDGISSVKYKINIQAIESYLTNKLAF